MAGSNNAEKTMMTLSSDARDPTGVSTPYSYTPSWPRDMLINNCKPCKGDSVWNEGEHSQGDFNAAVTCDKSDNPGGGYYCTIM